MPRVQSASDGVLFARDDGTLLLDTEETDVVCCCEPVEQPSACCGRIVGGNAKVPAWYDVTVFGYSPSVINMQLRLPRAGGGISCRTTSSHCFYYFENGPLGDPNRVTCFISVPTQSNPYPAGVGNQLTLFAPVPNSSGVVAPVRISQLDRCIEFLPPFVDLWTGCPNGSTLPPSHYPINSRITRVGQIFVMPGPLEPA